MKPFVFAVIAIGVIPYQAPAKVDTSVRAVLNRATAHLKEYQEQLQFVLADETTTQEVFNTAGHRVARRETKAEFFLAYIAGDAAWLAVRDISELDGKPVANREDVRSLLSRGSFARVGRAIADRNARYNIGSIARNFNDPMLGLLILDRRHRDRFRFDRRSVTGTGSAAVVTLAFRERDTPTLVRGTDGSQIFARGEIGIEAATGRLRRTLIQLKDGSTEATLTAVFEENAKLGLWLPTSLEERYEHKTSKLHELVVATSAYSNYRKFDVNVIIK